MYEPTLLQQPLYGGDQRLGSSAQVRSAWAVASSHAEAGLSIVRVIVVDPEPRDAADDLCIYQVPEKSRAHELLVSLCERAKLQFVTLEPQPRKAKRVYHTAGDHKWDHPDTAAERLACTACTPNHG